MPCIRYSRLFCCLHVLSSHVAIEAITYPFPLWLDLPRSEACVASGTCYFGHSSRWHLAQIAKRIEQWRHEFCPIAVCQACEQSQLLQNLSCKTQGQQRCKFQQLLPSDFYLFAQRGHKDVSTSVFLTFSIGEEIFATSRISHPAWFCHP